MCITYHKVVLTSALKYIMLGVMELGRTEVLSNCKLTRLDVDTEHHYYIDGEYAVSVTHILDIGAPFPEGLRQYLRVTDAEESEERMTMTRERGVKLHRALEDLMAGLPLSLVDFPTNYEKDAIVTFIRTMRFLQPDRKRSRMELIVADKKLMLGGTLDFDGRADKRRLDILADPTYKLETDGDDFVLVDKWKHLLDGPARMINFIADYKFTGRSNYNHKVQAMKYKGMRNASYAGSPKASRAYIWRYSPKHKHGFDFQEANQHKGMKITEASFNRIYTTALQYMGGFPEPPEIKIYPDTVALYETIKEEL